MELDTLIDRVRGLDGPDREVDALVDATLRIGGKGMREKAPWAWKNFPVWHPSKQRGMCEVAHSDGTGGLCWSSHPFTSSIDAVVALIERELPEGCWRVDDDCNNERTYAVATVGTHRAAEVDAVYGETAPLALLLAFLTAMKEK